MKVENRLTGDNSKLAVELNFRHLDDFSPARVAQQVAPLKELLEKRQQLTQLLSKMEGNDKLEQLLSEVIGNQQMQGALAKELGLEAPAAGADTPK